MHTLLLIELIWFFALGSGIGYLLSRRTVAGGLSGAFLVLLGLGLWYGWRGALYLWALQWTVYAAGILLLWAWLALDAPLAQTKKRMSPQAALLAGALFLWALTEALTDRTLILFPGLQPDLASVGMYLTHQWAILFVWASITLALVWLLLLLLWKEPLSARRFT